MVSNNNCLPHSSGPRTRRFQPWLRGGCCLWDPVESQPLPTNVVRCCQTLKAPGDESKWGPKSNNKSVLKGPSGGKSMAFSVCAMVRIWSTCSHSTRLSSLVVSPFTRWWPPPGSVCCFITPMNYSYDDHKPEWSTFIVNKPTPRESLTASPSFQDIPTYHHYKSL